MSYSCKILLDSISETGKRITTFEITFPRIILAEFNTHRMFSRNSASSRAIPFEKQIDRIYNDPFIPEQFPLNCKGMQPQEYITKDSSEYKFASQEWIIARNGAITQAKQLRDLNIHKQIINRLLEPFQYHTVIVTATEFGNFFKLRCNENAQYEIRRIADLMYEAYHYFDNFSPSEGDIRNIDEETAKYINKKSSERGWSAIRPQNLKIGEWHCPLVYEEDDEAISSFLIKTVGNNSFGGDMLQTYNELKKKISVARCARVSYLTHDGKRDIEKDLELFERLRTSGHYSPFEHVATPAFYDNGIFATSDKAYDEEFLSNRNFHNERYINLRNGNFIGWRQMRQDLPNENCTNFRKEN